ncbi:uncharacterized protein LOC120335351 isoform X2 [Styela clava]
MYLLLLTSKALLLMFALLSPVEGISLSDEEDAILVLPGFNYTADDDPRGNYDGFLNKHWKFVTLPEHQLKYTLWFKQKETSEESCDQFVVSKQNKFGNSSNFLCVDKLELKHVGTVEESAFNLFLEGPQRKFSLSVESYFAGGYQKQRFRRSILENVYSLPSTCHDAIRRVGVCSRHKAMNQCNWPTIRSQCQRTCNVCEYGSWGKWSPWSKCSVSCGFGVEFRTRLCRNMPCPPGNSEELRGCKSELCAETRRVVLQGRMLPQPRRNLYEVESYEEESPEDKCTKDEFMCSQSKQCHDLAKQCNEEADCSPDTDEDTCEFGLRYDGIFGIINWKYHKCAESNTTDDGRSTPRIYRRCPGPYNKERTDFMWSWADYHNIIHKGIHRCLALNITSFNGTKPNELEVILTHCDFNDPTQHWMCTGYYVRLLSPLDVLPDENRDDMYLNVSDDGPGNRWVMTSKPDDNSKFYMLGTNKRLNICAKRGAGGSFAWTFWTLCDKTCGGGTKRKKRNCAFHGDRNCGGGSLYEVKACNTQPCTILCPPDFSAHYSEYNEKDINCFKVFDDPRSYSDAQKFCASNNWTLAADKEISGHNFLMDLLEDSPKSYIGVYEDLSTPLHSPYTHLLRYNLDGQSVGGFQPWFKYSGSNEYRGCSIGFGATYHGSVSTSENGETCEIWNATDIPDIDVVHPLTLLVPPYSEIETDGNNFCRNEDISFNIPWCRVRSLQDFQRKSCKVDDCLDIGSTSSKGKFMPEIHENDKFIIYSLQPDSKNRKLCIAVLSTNKVVTALCDCKDERQNFYWWAGTSLVNAATGTCLSVTSLPPQHGDELIAETCTRRHSKSYQGWSVHNTRVSLSWIPDHGPEEKLPPLYIMTHDAKERKVLMSDTRRELFTAWNSDIGMVRMITLMSKTPGGSYFLLRGHACDECITSTIESKQLLTSVCSHQDINQRWIKLTENILMNVATGLCLSSYRMRFYVLLDDCDISNLAIRWIFRKNDDENFILRHSESGFYLTCGCIGYTQVCLSPENNEKVAWDLVVHDELFSVFNIPDFKEDLGFPFMLHSSYNLTRCAKPAKPSSAPDAMFVAVMTTCQLEDKGLLWWFSEGGSQIKHRALGLCLEAQIPLKSNKAYDNMNPTLLLAACSFESLTSQSWIFLPGPTPRDSDGMPGDFICLSSNHSVCLNIESDGGFGDRDDLLIVSLKTKSQDWIAVTGPGHHIPLEKLKDCAQPWDLMKDYRGTRSFTKDGVHCQYWNLQYPHKHPFTNITHPTADLRQNYCRRPEGFPTDQLKKDEIDLPWCITVKSSQPWQECSVTKCPITTVVLDSNSGLWHPSDGKTPLPFTCQSLPECYIGNGADYSGYYEHTGRGHCLNWREYNNGDKNWPDHARCMNWNNDTLKPWCWVRKGVAQYCDLTEPCPIRCPDPTPLMRNMYLLSISYASPSKLYMPKSSVQVACKKGYNLTNTDRIDQIWNCTDDGVWEPKPVSCRKIFCNPPASVDNAILITRKTLFTYGAVVAYQCKPGYMIEPSRTLIEITCRQNGTWSSPLFKCLPACKEGWTSFNLSCYKLFHHRKYFKNYHSSFEQCKSKKCGLAVPRTEVEYNFLRDLTVSTLGYSNKHYWVGIRDNSPADFKGSMVHRSWVGDGIGETLKEDQIYVDKLQNQTFMIQSFAVTMEKEKVVSHNDRCMYGDPESKKVFSQSCMYNEGVGMKWMWATHQHLYNLDAGLCLTSEEHPGDSDETIPDSVLLSECDMYNKSQMFTCGPENGYLLRLRHNPKSYIVLEQSHPNGEIRIGSHRARGNLAMWHTFPDFYYLCHWNFKQPDSIFLVHKDSSPNFNSFFREDDDPCRVNMTGATLASTTRVSEYMSTEQLDWCACAFIYDENGEKVNRMPNTLESCLSPGLSSDPGSSELKECKSQTFADSLCQRSNKSNPEHRTRPEMCVSISVPRKDDVKLEVRQCDTMLPGFICEEPAQWACPIPIEPKNSISVFETNDTSNMQFKYGSEVEITCKDGYWLESYSMYSMTIVCNKFLHWEVKPRKIREGDVENFIDNRVNREEAVNDIRCTKIKCEKPPKIMGMNLVSVTDESYIYTSVASYECLSGTWLSATKLQHNATCMSDGVWQPLPGDKELCKSVTCPDPQPIENANMTYDGNVYNSRLTYKCNKGFWYSRDHSIVFSYCSKDGRWIPDHIKQNTTCVPISCYTLSSSTLSDAKIMQIDEQTIYGYKNILTLRCEPGYWFDKDSFSLNFTCNEDGLWNPSPPDNVQCERIYCKQPDDVAGAARFGTDYASGSHVRYYCARRNWIRRQFKIHSPHWGLCLRLHGAVRSEIAPTESTDVVDVTLDNNCDGRDTPYHWWVWQWSFHLKNHATDRCLTAAAIPNLKDDVVPLRAEPCDEGNVFQMWTCSSGHTNEWLIVLRGSGRGGYLTTVTDDKAYWSGQGNVIPLVTGDHEATNVESYWKIYGSNDIGMNICIMKEGQFYEESVCNSFGEWYPDPHDIECSVVSCGEPIEIINADVWNEFDDVHEDSQPDSHRFFDVFSHVETNYDVGARVKYKCKTGFWIVPGVYSFSITCLDNSLWDPDPYNMACLPVTCPSPNVTSHSKAIIQKVLDTKDPLLYTKEEVMQMLETPSSIPPYRGDIVFGYKLNVSYIPMYSDHIKLVCLPGFWIERDSLSDETDRNQFIQSDMDGSNILKSQCLWNGSWSLPNIHDALSCVPLHCHDPGQIANSARVSDTVLVMDQVNETSPINATNLNNTGDINTNSSKNVNSTRSLVYNGTNDELKLFGYNSIVQYQCDMGFWFTVSRTYSEIRCNETGLWHPDPAQLKCVPVSCGDPGTVVDGIKVGENYSVHEEVLYQCNEGFKIGNKLSERRVKCMGDGRWFPPPFSIRCDRVECGLLPQMTHAYFYNETKKYKEKFTAGDEVTMRCKSGYQIDARTTEIKFKCDLQGEWVPGDESELGLFHCIVAICHPPPVVANLRLLDSRIQYHIDDHVYYVCPHGSTLRGSDDFMLDVTCKLNATVPVVRNEVETDRENIKRVYESYWYPDMTDITCNISSCPHPGLIENTALVVDGTKYEDIATYFCNIGYKFLETNELNANIQCGKLGLWIPDPQSLVCEPIQCDAPDINTMIEINTNRRYNSSYYYNDQISLSCPDKYWLVGIEKSARGEQEILIECSEDGSWTVDTDSFVCEIIHCIHPGIISDAVLLTDINPEPSEFPVSAYISIICKEGFVLSVTSTRSSQFQCSNTGRWTPVDLYDNPPSCVPLACPDPGMRNNSVKNVTGFGVGHRIIYHALPGYRSALSKKTIVVLICSSGGKWIKEKDTVDEPEPAVTHQSPVADFIDLNMTYFDQNINFTEPNTSYSDPNSTLSRKKRYISSNASSVRVNNLLDALLTFVPADCDLPIKLPEHLFVDKSQNETTYPRDSNVTLYCEEEYAITLEQDSVNLTCSDFGEWKPDYTQIKCVSNETIYCGLPKEVDKTDLIGDSYSIGSELIVRCQAGYEVTNGTSEVTIKCMLDGQWKPDTETLICKPIVCTPPPAISNAELNYNNLAFNSKASYQCNDGFNFNSPGIYKKLTITCINSALWRPDPSQYVCVMVGCSEPLQIPYGEVKYNDTQYGATASYLCHGGYILSVDGQQQNSANASCNTDGYWTFGSPDNPTDIRHVRCEPTTCTKIPPPITNSHSVLFAGNFYKSTALYRCLTGYETPSGVKSFNYTCSENGTWVLNADNVTEAQCRKVKCPLEPTIDEIQRAFKHNNEFLSEPIRQEYGDIIKHQCKSKDHLQFIQTCTWFGKWEPEMKLSCAEVKCAEPPKMDNAQGTGDKELGSTWKYTCNDGYEIKHNMNNVKMECVKNDKGLGVWIPPFYSIMKCHPYSCDLPHYIPPHVKVLDEDEKELAPSELFTGTEYDLKVNSKLTYQCMEGFWGMPDKIYEKTTTCTDDREWNPNPANLIKCTTVTCDPPPKVENITIHGELASKQYWFNTTVRYDCPEEMFVAHLKEHQVESRCGPEGVFIPDPLTLNCTNTTCDEYMMPHADLYSKTGLDIYDSASYRCHSGYWFERGMTEYKYTCGPDGKWDPNVQNHHCVKSTCQLPQYANLHFKNSKNIEYGDEIEVYCDDGYQLVDADKATIKSKINCVEDGKFEPSVDLLSCSPIPCDPPDHLPNATVYGDFNYGGKAYLQCKYGYWISSNKHSTTATCGRDGIWSANFTDKAYKCVIIVCPTPPKSQNAIQEGNSTSFNSVVKYTCNKGFWLGPQHKGNPYEVEEVCSLMASWEPFAFVSCIRIICPSPPAVASANIFGDKPWFDNVFTYVCHPMKWIARLKDDNWIITGQKEFNIVCKNDGQWFPEPDFKCISLYDAQPTTAGKSKDNEEGSGVKQLSERLDKEWLKFEPDTMTISDGLSAIFTEEKLKNLTVRSHRDIKFMWDANPLTFWVGSKNAFSLENEWIIDIYLGRPRAVLGMMIMCADDSISDVSNFSIIFASEDKEVKEIGPFKVYGDEGTSGSVDTKFHLNYSSIANAFVFNEISEEILWMHIILRSLNDGFVPVVREIGFFASEVEWEWIYPVDITSGLHLMIIFVALLCLMSPILYLLDRNYTRRTMIFTPPNPSKNKGYTFYQISFETLKTVNAKCKIFLQVIGTKAEGPIIWIRRDFCPQLMRENYKNIVCFSMKKEKFGEIQRIRLLSWIGPVSAVQSTDGKDILKSEDSVKLTNINVKQLDDRKHKYSVTKLLSMNDDENFIQLQQLTPANLVLEKIEESETHVMLNSRHFRFLRCNLLFSLLKPPPGSIISRLERFLCLMLILVGGCLSSLYLQLFVSMQDPNEPHSIGKFIGGDVLISVIGTIILLPIPLLLRSLFFVCWRITKIPLSSEGVGRYFIHDILDLKQSKHSFAPALQTPLKAFYGLLPSNKVNASTSMSMLSKFEFLVHDYSKTNSDKILSRRWSESAIPRRSPLEPFEAKQIASCTALSLGEKRSSSYKNISCVEVQPNTLANIDEVQKQMSAIADMQVLKVEDDPNKDVLDFSGLDNFIKIIGVDAEPQDEIEGLTNTEEMKQFGLATECTRLGFKPLFFKIENDSNLSETVLVPSDTIDSETISELTTDSYDADSSSLESTVYESKSDTSYDATQSEVLATTSTSGGSSNDTSSVDDDTLSTGTVKEKSTISDITSVSSLSHHTLSSANNSSDDDNSSSNKSESKISKKSCEILEMTRKISSSDHYENSTSKSNDSHNNSTNENKKTSTSAISSSKKENDSDGDYIIVNVTSQDEDSVYGSENDITTYRHGKGDRNSKDLMKKPSLSTVDSDKTNSHSSFLLKSSISISSDDESGSEPIKTSFSYSQSTVPYPSGKYDLLDVKKENPNVADDNICCHGEESEKKLQHKYLYTHLPVTTRSCQLFFHFVSIILFAGIVCCSVSLIFIAQEMTSSGIGNITKLALFSILFTILVVLPIDTVLSILIFREHVQKLHIR